MLHAFPKLDFFSLTLHEEFRGVRTREGILLAGPLGWGEFSPFPNYTATQDSLWLRAALESAFVPLKYPENSSVAVNAIIGDNEDSYLRSARALNEFGCTTIKIKVGLDVDQDVERVQEIVRAFVDAGQLNKLLIRLDANGRWGIAQAVDTITELQSVPIEYIEQPCRSATQLRELRKKVTVPIAVDEIIRIDGQHQVSEFADLAIIKVSPLGGTDAVERLIEKLDVPVRFSSAFESSVGLNSSLLAAHKFAPHQVAGLGTGMLLATDTVKRPVIPHEGRIRVVKCEPDPEQLKRVPLPQTEQDLWRKRLAKAWDLIPESQLASWGVPKWSVQG